ncbi:mitochondrial putative NADH:ubiquinone oxidoreductase 6.5 kDa subunit [Dunaliella salina]|uniref:Mitochondrial putative NADH:ubiquinone oxidoreductase 6.5 kDa subunit n=1 Tax=Dunaliella salina TaxID=3046 RepID=A0ABQ7GTU4_DUNSA|nr:mitochondrial putative NADH:ubiquinone oxidoreductase 6.5 kDa subunit [Dunaliella salina]|eukprot:KAF5838012.1 mitochondrial putative NADH:ubiquinone oxidoreductase 6.5 kDa subunit [Dunaliella salina]
MGFRWDKYEAWRHHPLLKVDKRNLFPGLRIGFGAFVVFKIYESATAPEQKH